MKKLVDFLVSGSDWIVIVGGIITLLGTVLVNIKSNKESDANKAEQAKILEQSLKINSVITGGDSYPLVVFHDIDPVFGVSQYVISNQGDYPITATQMTISDVKSNQRVMNNPSNMTNMGINLDLLEPYNKTFPLHEIMPRTGITMNTFPYKFIDGGIYSITIMARNGNFIQTVITHKEQNTWLIAYRVTMFPSNKVITQSVPANFPNALLTW